MIYCSYANVLFVDGSELTAEELEAIDAAANGVRMAARLVDTPCNEMTVDDFVQVNLLFTFLYVVLNFLFNLYCNFDFTLKHNRFVKNNYFLNIIEYRSCGWIFEHNANNHSWRRTTEKRFRWYLRCW